MRSRLNVRLDGRARFRRLREPFQEADSLFALLQAANELLEEGFFAFAGGFPGGPPWPQHLLSLTVVLANPRAFAAGVRWDNTVSRHLAM